MEEFLQTQTNAKLKHLLLSHLAAHRKTLQDLFMYQNRSLNGHTPLERLAYIVHKQEYETLKELNSIFRSIKIGTVSLRSRQFDDFLMKHSEDSTESGNVVYDDDFSDSDSCVEEIALG